MRKKTMCLSCLVYARCGMSRRGPEPEIATTVSFTEGPTVDRDGNVYFTEIIQQRIMKLGPTACSRPIARTATSPTGC